MAEKHIVGDWKSFTFHMATLEDFPKIAKHVNDHFLTGEPMNMLLGWCDKNATDHEEIVRAALGHGLSFYMTEKDKDEIVACNLMLDSRLPSFENLEFTSTICKHIIGFLDHLDTTTKPIFLNQFKCDFYAEIFISSVDSKYRGQGIATEMYRRSEPFLKTKGFTVLKVGFSAPGTRAIGKKLGYIEYGSEYLNKYIDENGQQIFPNAKDDQIVVETAKFL